MFPFHSIASRDVFWDLRNNGCVVRSLKDKRHRWRWRMKQAELIVIAQCMRTGYILPMEEVNYIANKLMEVVNK